MHRLRRTDSVVGEQGHQGSDIMGTNDLNMPDAATDLWLEQQRADDMLQPQRDEIEIDSISHKKAKTVKPHKLIKLLKTENKKSSAKDGKQQAKDANRIKKTGTQSDL